ncbi:hypothetical protein [Spirosoma endophyticum]|uniref:hypothetical protein n=1 Tax=Spirosoma endophyticum TaxID=662367 RepID=UPI0015A5B221|nr:hypothetical protein [Spirosoma endophyticum]
MKNFLHDLGIVDIWTGLCALISLVILFYLLSAIHGSGVVMNGAGIGGITEY